MNDAYDGSYKQYGSASAGFNAMFGGGRVTTPTVPNDPPEDECECGGMLDEYDRCDRCDSGHDDCDANECFPCLERAIGRAESMAEGMDR